MISRRRFLQQSALGAVGLSVAGCASTRSARKFSPNEKLNIAVIGVAARGKENLDGVAGENIVALCDVDDNSLRAAARSFPQARTYHDFRLMLEQRNIDAVVVSTPDHTHAVAAVAALRSGRPVYCEKPLTRTISECRIVRETARKSGLATQMGTQIHAGTNYRRVVELIQSGAIGPVREVHVWVGGRFGGKARPTDTPPVPPQLHYDLWVGPTEAWPYHTEWVPFNWRHWWPFGGGQLADLGCHYIDLAFWALDLRTPLTVEAEGPAPHPDSAPFSLRVRYEFAAREEKPPVLLTWHHGDFKPPQIKEGKAPNWGGGNLFVGEKGMLIADYGRHLLLPEKEFSGFVRPEPFIKDSIGHHKEWIEACKTGSATTCNFDYSGALTEAVLLGNVAFRAGKRLYWDAKKMSASNCPEADPFIRHQYRPGWVL
jgi:predicted dehydrogenase